MSLHLASLLRRPFPFPEPVFLSERQDNAAGEALSFSSGESHLRHINQGLEQKGQWNTFEGYGGFIFSDNSLLLGQRQNTGGIFAPIGFSLGPHQDGSSHLNDGRLFKMLAQAARWAMKGDNWRPVARPIETVDRLKSGDVAIVPWGCVKVAQSPDRVQALRDILDAAIQAGGCGAGAIMASYAEGLFLRPATLQTTFAPPGAGPRMGEAVGDALRDLFGADWPWYLIDQIYQCLPLVLAKSRPHPLSAHQILRLRKNCGKVFDHIQRCHL